MLEVFSKLLCSASISITSFLIIKETTHSKEKLNIKNILLLSLLILIPFTIYKIQYTSTYTLITYLISIIVYRLIFGYNLPKTVVATSIMMVITFIGDFCTMIILMNFYDVESIRKIWYIRLLANFITCFISILICLLVKNKKFIININNKFKNPNDKTSLVFMFLLIIVFTIIAYNFYSQFSWNAEYIVNVIIVFIFLILMYIYFQEKNNFAKLSDDYDNLFNYIQNFENWIEKEQLNRHEYKNQLAVLRTLSKNKKINSKIDEILEDNINIEGDIVKQLKRLPKGGIKGLMYYKLVIAQKNKIKLTVDVSIKRKSILNRLSEKKVRDLCKLIGIYFDNAIEASSETKKKVVLVEIYELKDRVNIVFSNTFKDSNLIKNSKEKGASSKGAGRGKGLYFAKKIISKNNWLEESQEIIDKYYIQKISILKLEK